VIPHKIDRRIFVVGAPRSGTTLVQSLLAAHHEVTSFTESHFFSRHFKLLPKLSTAILTRNPTARLQAFLAENGLTENDAPGGLTAESILGDPGPSWLLPLRTGAVARRFLQALDELALRRGTSTWVEKTPRHLCYIPFIERLSSREPRTHFVHVIRNGLEVVASLHTASKQWERPYDLVTCVERWNADLGFSLSRVPRKKDQGGSSADHVVSYEHLTASPSATLERLFADLGLAWDPEVLKRYGPSSGQLITQEETWKANVDRRMRPSETSHQVLTEEQRDGVNASLHHDLYRQLVEQAL